MQKKKIIKKGGTVCGAACIAGVYIYVDFMSVCLSCLGITEIVRHFFRVCVCVWERVCVSAFIFSYFVFQQAFPLLLFLCVRFSHLVYCVCFVAARYAANNFIYGTPCVCALCIPCKHRKARGELEDQTAKCFSMQRSKLNLLFTLHVITLSLAYPLACHTILWLTKICVCVQA